MNQTSPDRRSNGRSANKASELIADREKEESKYLLPSRMPKEIR